MRVVPTTNTPNQSFTVTLDNVRWSLRLSQCGGVWAVDIDRDGAPILKGVRTVAGEPLIPYRYLQTGNFIFLTEGDVFPSPGAVLIYLSAAEISMLTPVTIGDVLAAADRVEYLFTDEGFYLTTDAGDLIEDA